MASPATPAAAVAPLRRGDAFVVAFPHGSAFGCVLLVNEARGHTLVALQSGAVGTIPTPDVLAARERLARFRVDS